MKLELITGVIQADETVLAEDGTVYPIDDVNDTLYFTKNQQVNKHLVGATVEFLKSGKDGTPRNFRIIKLAESK